MNEKDKRIFRGFSMERVGRKEFDTWWSITSEKEQELKTKHPFNIKILNN